MRSEPRPIREKRPGVVREGEAYTLKEFLARVGWGRDAYRTARRKGLKVSKVCGRIYISGRDAIQFLVGPPA